MQIIEIIPPKQARSFDKPPIFNINEQQKYFKQEPILQELLCQIRKPEAKAGLLLQYGYFKATKRFFQKEEFKKKDIIFISKLLGYREVAISDYKERTYREHKRLILSISGFTSFSSNKDLLKVELNHMASQQMHPRNIFFAAIDFLTSKKIELPNYRVFAKMITESFNLFESQSLKKIEINITEEHKEVLDALLDKNDSKGVYARNLVARLKNINQSLRPKNIKQSIRGFLIVKNLFKELEPLIKSLDLSPEATKYYAIWVIKARVEQLSTLNNPNKIYLYLAAFINYQYCTWQDTLIDILLRANQERLNKVEKAIEEKIIEKNEEKNKKTQSIIEGFKRSEESIEKIRKIVFLKELTDAEKITILQSILGEQITTEEVKKYQELEKEILHELSNSEYYEVLESFSRTIQNRVADIVRYVEFNPETKSSNLMEAIVDYQKKKGDINSTAPRKFLSNIEQKLIFGKTNDQFNVSLYKAVLLTKISDAIKSGEVNLLNSYKFLPIEAYLISDDVWEKERETLIERAGVGKFKKIKDLLLKLKDILEKQYYITNCNITDKTNKFIKFRKNGRFILHTPKVERGEHDKISSLLSKNEYKSVLEIFSEIDKILSFTECFKHYKVKNISKKPAKEIFYGGIFGLGTNMGLHRLSNTSKGINYNTLYNTVNWYFTVENLSTINKSFIQFMSKLWLPTLFLKDKELLHSSGDAKKFVVSAESLNANFSFKYFGQNHGSSVYTFLDERQMLFYTTIFSSSERDAGYVIDGLLHNADINIDTHSTDTHGYTEIIFAICYLIGVDFAPRIKNIAAQSIFAFNKSTKQILKAQHKTPILPARYIKTSVIEENWDSILRLIVTIKLRNTQASRILRRLSSYAKQHQLHEALKEFGRIIKSIFILKYIDNVELRQQIEKQLNKGELSNRFSSIIFFANNQEFTQSITEDQEIVVQCKMIIQNLIILWNYLMLTKLIMRCNPEKRKEIIDIIKHGSIITWRHINLLGIYDFNNLKKADITLDDAKEILLYNKAA